MSRETLSWLNNNVLVGFTDKRGPAWHGRRGDDNHYPGAVPVADVRKRLFSFEVEEVPVGTIEHTLTSTGVAETHETIPGLKAIRHKDTHKVFDIVSLNWQPHLYDEWLIQNVETILDDELQIGTAGLLEGGGKAWVQVEKPDTVEFAGGVLARPFLLAATALSRKLSTTYGLSVTNTVCDNTMNIALGEHGGFRQKIRHSKNSLDKIQDVREALGIIHTATDSFGKQVEELLNQRVSERQFLSIVESEVPGKIPTLSDFSGPQFHRKLTHWKKVQEKRTFIHDLYRFDERVAPWTGTGYGVWQAFNTYQQHETAIQKKTIRVERNAKKMIAGDLARDDQRILEKIGALS